MGTGDVITLKGAYLGRTMSGQGFILVYRLGEDGDLLKEGDGMLSVWSLRARSYKTKAEA